MNIYRHPQINIYLKKKNFTKLCKTQCLIYIHLILKDNKTVQFKAFSSALFSFGIRCLSLTDDKSFSQMTLSG